MNIGTMLPPQAKEIFFSPYFLLFFSNERSFLQPFLLADLFLRLFIIMKAIAHLGLLSVTISNLASSGINIHTGP